MKKLWMTASIIAALSVFAAGAVKLVATTSTPAAAVVQSKGPVGAPLHVPSQCTSSNMQIPTSAGLEWEQIVVCPDTE